MENEGNVTIRLADSKIIVILRTIFPNTPIAKLLSSSSGETTTKSPPPFSRQSFDNLSLVGAFQIF